MPTDARLSKKIRIGTISTETEFEDFEAISLWDAGDDGFNMEDEDGNSCVVPTGITIGVGGSTLKNCSYLKITDPDGGVLNCSYILYQ